MDLFICNDSAYSSFSTIGPYINDMNNSDKENEKLKRSLTSIFYKLNQLTQSN